MEQTRVTLEASKQALSFGSQKMHIVAETQFTRRQRDLLQRKMAMESSDKAHLRLCEIGPCSNIYRASGVREGPGYPKAFND
jgi:hypothetical protein